MTKQIDIAGIFNKAERCFDGGEFAESARLYGVIANYFESNETEINIKGSPSFYNSYGLALKRCGNLILAEQVYLKANRLSHFRNPSFLNNLAVCYFEMGDYCQSNQYYLKSLDIVKSRGNDIYDFAFYQCNLGTLLSSKGDWVKAKTMLLDSLEKFQQIHSRSNIAHSHFRLGFLLCQMGYYTDAIRFLEAAIHGKYEIYSHSHPRVAEIILSLAEVHLARGDYRRAESLTRRALGTFEKTLDPNAPHIARCHLRLGEIKCRRGLIQGDLQNNLQQAYAIIKRSYLSAINPDMADYYALRGELLMYERELNRAILFLQKSLRIRQKLFKPVHPALAVNFNHIGYCQAQLGQVTQARVSYIKSLHIFKRIHRQHSWLPMLLRNIAALYEGRILETICLNKGRKLAKKNISLLKDADLEKMSLPTLFPEEKPKTQILPEARIILIATADMQHPAQLLLNKIKGMINYYQGTLPVLAKFEYIQNEENVNTIIDLLISEKTEKPFFKTFVCLIGKDYGSVFKPKPEWLKRFPWMTDYRDRSNWEVLLRCCIHSEMAGAVYHLPKTISKTDIENPYLKIQSLIREIQNDKALQKVKTVAVPNTKSCDIEKIMHRLNTIILEAQREFQMETSNGDGSK